MLEHHAHLLAVDVNICVFVSNIAAVKQNCAACGNFQEVQTAKKGGFAGTGGTDHNNNFAFVDICADTVQRFDRVTVIVFFKLLCGDNNIIVHCF